MLPTYRSFIKKNGDGKEVSLWYDTWLHQTLRQSLVGPLPQNGNRRKVDSILKKTSNNLVWNLNDLPFHLPKEILMEIKSLPLAQNFTAPKYQTIWKLTENGHFSSKSGYLWLLASSKNYNLRHQAQTTKNHHWIWKMLGHPCEIFFLWQTVSKCLPLNYYLHKINYVNGDLCPLC